MTSDDARLAAIIAEMRQFEALPEPTIDVARFGAERTAQEQAEIERLTAAPSIDPEVQRLLDQG